MKKTAKKKTAKARLPGDLSERQMIERIIRVDHAGEFGAQRIYAGQLSRLKGSKIEKTVQHMAEQEDAHLAAFEKLMIEHGVRPTALYPVWNIAGFALGAITAALGDKTAMACTVAIEETIDEHYAQQLEYLKDRNPKLAKLIKKFRDEEIEHRDIGIQHEAEELPYYLPLRAAIRAGSKAAIWLSERV